MEDDEDVVEITEVQQEETSEEKPIMSLFKRLSNTQNTVLTNAQFEEILQEEFELEIDNLHELEKDVYMHVLKKYLKEWPQWVQFDETIKSIKSKGDYAALNAVLQILYKSLKRYLKLFIDIAMPLTRDFVEKLESTTIKNAKSKNIDNIVLEVCCNRAQLNKLFFRQPHPGEDGTIFNIDESAPTKISVTKPTIHGILNSFEVFVALTIDCVSITRFTIHEIDHVLVNKKLNIPRQKHISTPNEMLQMNKHLKLGVDIKKKDILDYLARVYKKSKLLDLIEALTVLEVIMTDIAEGPEIFGVPADYRKYMSKYVYKRYLNADLPDETEPSEKYDLRLEETISPRYQYTIHRYDKSNERAYSLQIECMQCNVKFKGKHVLRKLEQHYLGFHSQEMDVICAHCSKSFSIDFLTDKRWHHKC